jgi:hypothetical protein
MIIKDEHIGWAAFIIVAILFVAYMQGYFDKKSPQTEQLAQLTQAECNIIHSAINLVLRDIGHYKTTGEAIESLMMEIPQRPKDCRPIIQTALGKPNNLDVFRDTLTLIKDHLPFKENTDES